MAAVVLIHGAGLDRRSWDLVAAELAGLDVVAVDLPGRGADATPLADVTVEGCVDAIVEAAGDGPVVLVAHSLGAALVRPAMVALDGRVVHVCWWPPTCRRPASPRSSSTAASSVGGTGGRPSRCRPSSPDS